jgi:hypothetical protein
MEIAICGLADATLAKRGRQATARSTALVFMVFSLICAGRTVVDVIVRQGGTGMLGHCEKKSKVWHGGVDMKQYVCPAIFSFGFQKKSFLATEDNTKGAHHRPLFHRR